MRVRQHRPSDARWAVNAIFGLSERALAEGPTIVFTSFTDVDLFVGSLGHVAANVTDPVRECRHALRLGNGSGAFELAAVGVAHAVRPDFTNGFARNDRVVARNSSVDIDAEDLAEHVGEILRKACEGITNTEVELAVRTNIERTANMVRRVSERRS